MFYMANECMLLIHYQHFTLRTIPFLYPIATETFESKNTHSFTHSPYYIEHPYRHNIGQPTKTKSHIYATHPHG